MTLSGRNTMFKFGILLCSVCVLLTLAVSFPVISAYPLQDDDSLRPAGFFPSLFCRFMDFDYYALHAALVITAVYALAAVIIIYNYFKQTQSREILYIAFFAFSFSVEPVRFILPLCSVYDISSFYLLAAYKVLTFGRYFGIFSLFTASICAAGMDEQKSRVSVFVIIGAALLVTLSIPVDLQSRDTSFNMINVYASLFSMIETVAFLSTVISFFAAVHVRGSREYFWIGLGAMLALVGRTVLLSAENWASPAAGILLLSAGTWFICSRLHKINLWL